MDRDSLQRFDKPATSQLTAEEALVMVLLDVIEEPVGGDAGHVRRVRQGSVILADELRRDDEFRSEIDDEFLRHLYWASPLHDVGKIAVDRRILAKPDRLTPAEIDEVRQHVPAGTRLLERAGELADRSPLLAMATSIARYHHERFDGTGYLEGLKGDQIPLAARIVALADVYDALTSRRVYKPVHAPEEARQMIRGESGRHFDPRIVAAFESRFADFAELARRENVQTHGPHVDPSLRASLKSGHLS
ncbi:MAG TPA: HD domain-containing phosphohydrolase [Pirellulales bacterium]|nr:HD domain-containing phosphohydrolase [Pirellulales bacterium]